MSNLLSRNEKLLIHSWMLYSDLISRFNVLLEECIHLQDTVHGLLEMPAATFTEKMRGRESCLIKRPGNIDSNSPPSRLCLSEKEKEALALDKELDDSYPQHSATQKTYLDLWMALCHLIQGLDENLKTCTESYEAFVKERKEQKNEEEIGAEFFHFSAKRGFFVHTAFAIYTNHLQLHHLKLLQLTETMPSQPPNPVLLRRWVSKLDEDVLSQYSRHVSWETAFFAARMGNAKEGVQKYFYDLFNKMRFHHSWTHSPTSTINSLYTLRKEDGEIHSVASIRSPFFYLEHPQLYPLLYHEFAHVALRQVERSAGEYPLGKFYDDRVDLIDILKGAGHNQWKVGWDDFTSEVWADTMAVCLGGKAYLSALNAQLFGFSFNSHKSAPDEVPLKELGRESKEPCEAPDTYGYSSYLWIARLRIAITVYEKTHGGLTEPEVEWLDCLKAGLDAYCNSRNKDYNGKDRDDNKGNGGKKNTYQKNWIYQQEFNEWVAEVCINKLKCHWKPLSKRMKVSDFLKVDSAVITAIDKVAEKYGGVIFAGRTNNNSLKLDETARIDSVPLSVKYYISRNVVQEILNPRPDDSLEKWTREFVRHIRNDGQAAFRIAIEWWLSRHDFDESLAELLESVKNSKHSDQDENFKRLDSTLTKFTDTLRKKWIKDLPASRTCIDDENIAQHIRSNYRYGRYYKEHNYQNRRERVKQLFEQGLADVASYIATGIARWSSVDTCVEEDRFEIGTMLLGALQPSWVGRNGGLIPAVNKAKTWFYDDWKKGYKNKAPSFNNYFHEDELFFRGMLGEYSFAAFIPEATPLELQTDHKIDLPQMICKPRLVYRVWDSRTKSQATNSQQKRSGFEWMSMLRMRYRWEWQILRGILNNNKEKLFPNTQLFLSSGWEQAIIFSSCAGIPDLAKQLEAIRQLTGDSLTNFLFEAPPDDVVFVSAAVQDHGKDVNIEEFKKKIKDNMLTCKIKAYTRPFSPCFEGDERCSIVDITGRNDFLIQWPCDDPNKIFMCINRIITPRQWEQITNFRTYAKINNNNSGDRISKFESEITFRTPSPWLID